MVSGPRGPPVHVVKAAFHFPCILSNVGSSPAAEAVARHLLSTTGNCWTTSRLTSEGHVEIAGHVVPFSSLQPLHSITTSTDGKQGATVLQYIGIRRLGKPRPSPRSDDGEDLTTDNSGGELDIFSLDCLEVEIWAELEMQARPNTCICSNPANWPAWRRLLPLLSTSTREEVATGDFSKPCVSEVLKLQPVSWQQLGGAADTTSPTGLAQEPSQRPSATGNKDKATPAVHALEEVYASLRPQAPQISRIIRGSGESLGVGPGPGVRGLNALPAAVVLKVAHYLSASALDALTASCRAQHHTCSALVPGLLLDLFPHQIEAIQWMRDRERGRAPRPHPELRPLVSLPSSQSRANGSADSSADGPPDRTSHEQHRSVFPRLWVNVVDGMVWPVAPPPCRPVRGGMLCDEPGLGKTITVLALLLRTRGLSPALPIPGFAASSSRSGSGRASRDAWQHWGGMERRGAMVKILRALQLEDPEGVFSRKLDEQTLAELGMEDYTAVVSDPIDLQKIAMRTSCGPRDGQYQTFEEFASDVRKVFSNAILYHGGRGGCDGDKQVPRRRALPLVAEAAARLSKKAEELFQGVFVGRRVDRGEALAERLRSLKPSSATLIVVPPPMLPHWKNQLTMHAQPGRLGALLFDERSDVPLPATEALAAFGVVVTTYQRLTNEQPRWAESPLSRIYWLRMVLDEGHALGTSALTSCGDVARRVEAERRWVMTGTPTPTTSPDAALRHLSNLMSFLREREHSQDWRRNIRGPFMANKPEGRHRLQTLLSEVMIRHTKSDVLAIPPPTRESALLVMSQQEALAYDTIVSFVRSNLLLTSMEGKTSGWQDSLLNPANTKYAMEALTNIRLSCCGGGTLIPVVKRHHHVETMDMLRDLHAVGDIDLRRIDNFINRATTGEVSSCQGCGEPLQLLHVTPCAHLICVDCVDCVNSACKVCGKPYDVDDFQRIQPGFELKWMYNIREQERLHQQRRAAARLQRRGSVPASSSTSPRRSTPAAIGSPATPSGTAEGAKSASSLADPTATGSVAGSGNGTFTAGGGSGSSPEGAGSGTHGVAGSDSLLDEEDEELEMHSKAFYAIEKLKSIRDRTAEKKQRRDVRPLKAIVFSQFLPVLNIVGDKFLREFGGYPAKGWQSKGEKCVAEFWGKNRAKELERFRTDPECFVLLLGKKGAHGLDLSFVTHMFLMDQIWDRSLETQVIARANRMGAKGSVSVVQLIMQDTMEEQLRTYVNRGADSGAPSTNAESPPGTPKPVSGRQTSPAEAAARAVNGGILSEKTPAGESGTSREAAEKASKKRPRSRGVGRRASQTLTSSQQDHAKVHFLLTSLRSSRGASAAGGGGNAFGQVESVDYDQDRESVEEDEEVRVRQNDDEDDSVEEWHGNGKGKGKSEGKAVRRAVTFAPNSFAGDVDEDEEVEEDEMATAATEINASGVYLDEPMLKNSGDGGRGSHFGVNGARHQVETGGATDANGSARSDRPDGCGEAVRTKIGDGGVKRRRVMFADGVQVSGSG